MLNASLPAAPPPSCALPRSLVAIYPLSTKRSCLLHKQARYKVQKFHLPSKRRGGEERFRDARGAAAGHSCWCGLGELHCRRCMASQPAPSQRAKRSQLKTTQSLHVVALSDQLRPAAVLDGLPAGGLHHGVHPHVADGLGGGELNLRAGGRAGRGRQGKEEERMGRVSARHGPRHAGRCFSRLGSQQLLSRQPAPHPASLPNKPKRPTPATVPRRTSMGKKVSAGAAGTTNSALPVRLVLSMSSMLHTRQLLRMSYRQSPSICTAQEEEGGRQAGQRAAQAQMHTVIQSKGSQTGWQPPQRLKPTPTTARPPAHPPAGPPG